MMDSEVIIGVTTLVVVLGGGVLFLIRDSRKIRSERRIEREALDLLHNHFWRMVAGQEQLSTHLIGQYASDMKKVLGSVSVDRTKPLTVGSFEATVKLIEEAGNAHYEKLRRILPLEWFECLRNCRLKN